VDGAVLDVPCVYNDKVFFGGSRYVFALSALTGATLWQSNVGLRCTTPAAANGIVVLGTESKLTALYTATGGIAWQHTGSNSYSTPAIANGCVYAISDNNHRSGLQAFNLNTGQKIWDGDERINIYYRDCAPSVGYGKVICPGYGSRQELVYGPASSNKPRLIPEP
jgi:outer membrane protein assembly factor BamB